MAAVATLAVPTRDRSDVLTPGQALRVAWCCWLMLLSIPALVFLIVMWRMMDGEVSGLDGVFADISATDQPADISA